MRLCDAIGRIFLSALILPAIAASAAEAADLVARTSVGGVAVEVTIEGGKLLVRGDGGEMPVELRAQPFLNEPPADPAVVALDGASELQAASWLDRGIVAAIETTDGGGKRHYRWATIYVDLAGKSASPVATAEFHASDEDLEIVAVRNPQGDSITALLSRYEREAPEPFQTFAFEHHCPIYSGGGTVHRLRAEPLDPAAAAPTP